MTNGKWAEAVAAVTTFAWKDWGKARNSVYLNLYFPKASETRYHGRQQTQFAQFDPSPDFTTQLYCVEKCRAPGSVCGFAEPAALSHKHGVAQRQSLVRRTEQRVHFISCASCGEKLYQGSQPQISMWNLQIQDAQMYAVTHYIPTLHWLYQKTNSCRRIIRTTDSCYKIRRNWQGLRATGPPAWHKWLTLLTLLRGK
jgi:hypothetical protein